MARFSFSVGDRQGMAPASGDVGIPAFSEGFPAEASTLIAAVVIEAMLLAALRRYFRHHHGG